VKSKGEHRIGGRSGRRVRLPDGATAVVKRKERTNGYVMLWRKPPGLVAEVMQAARVLYLAKVAANNSDGTHDMCGVDPRVTAAHRALEQFLQAGHRLWGESPDDQQPADGAPVGNLLTSQA
jgi:hypothetical protein